MRRSGAVAVAAAGAVAVFAGSGASGAPGACAPSSLAAKMSVIRGSAGAGNIEYRVLLRNTGSSACSVSGHPALRLLGAKGAPLPTHVTPVQPGVTAALIGLAPGHRPRRRCASCRMSPAPASSRSGSASHRPPRGDHAREPRARHGERPIFRQRQSASTAG